MNTQDLMLGNIVQCYVNNIKKYNECDIDDNMPLTVKVVGIIDDEVHIKYHNTVYKAYGEDLMPIYFERDYTIILNSGFSFKNGHYDYERFGQPTISLRQSIEDKKLVTTTAIYYHNKDVAVIYNDIRTLHELQNMLHCLKIYVNFVV